MFLLNQVKRDIQNHVKSLATDVQAKRVVSLKPQGQIKGNVLLSYILDPLPSHIAEKFLLRPQKVSNKHTNFWESRQIAKTFLELGYAVDVIAFWNETFTPKKSYDVVIDSRQNLQRLAPFLKQDCLKIFHIDVANTLFNSTAEFNRLLALQQRRGITLTPRRLELPNLGIDYADCATMIGNEFTRNTFKHANKPIYPVPLPCATRYAWSEAKDFESCRKRFLWFGSFALVHKGLDLVLEAFAEMPEYHLTVCGPIKKEPDFEAAFHKELYETPNIQTIGWVDVESPEFRAILDSNIACIYASSSEGQAGSVVTCMQGGLIPIISYECGVNFPDGAGILLEDCSIESIKKSVHKIANSPASELQEKARANWEYARANYTREKYAEAYRNIVKTILKL